MNGTRWKASPPDAREGPARRGSGRREAAARRAARSRLLLVLTIVLGGIAGLCTSVVLLWVAMGRDPFGLIAAGKGNQGAPDKPVPAGSSRSDPRQAQPNPAAPHNPGRSGGPRPDPSAGGATKQGRPDAVRPAVPGKGTLKGHPSKATSGKGNGEGKGKGKGKQANRLPGWPKDGDGQPKAPAMPAPAGPRRESAKSADAVRQAWQRGSQALAARQWALAVRHFTDALALQPDNATLLAYRGLAYANLDQLDAALADLNRSLSLRPDDPIALEHRAFVYLRKKDFARAIRDAQHVLKKRPKSALAHFIIGESHRLQSDYAEAVAALEKALAASPSHLLALRSLALAHAESNDPKYRDPKRAIKYAQSACARTKGRSAVDLFILARAHESDRNWDAAAQFLQQAIRQAGPTRRAQYEARLREVLARRAADSPSKMSTAFRRIDPKSLPKKKLEDAGKKYAEVYGEEEKGIGQKPRAVRPEAYRKLVTGELLPAAAEETDPAIRYVLMENAVRCAIESGDPILTFRVIDQWAASFVVDAFAWRLKAIERWHASIGGQFKGAERQARRAALFDVIVPVAEDATRARRYKIAAQLHELAARQVRQHAVLHRQQKNAARTARARAKLYEQIEARLRASGDDLSPENATELGKKLALELEDWDRGLALLAHGNGRLRELAEQDRAAPADPKQQIALGEAWQQLAQQGTWNDTEKLAMLRRARHWYERALPAVGGLERKRLQKILEDLSRTPGLDTYRRPDETIVFDLSRSDRRGPVALAGVIRAQLVLSAGTRSWRIERPGSAAEVTYRIQVARPIATCRLLARLHVLRNLDPTARARILVSPDGKNWQEVATATAGPPRPVFLGLRLNVGPLVRGTRELYVRAVMEARNPAAVQFLPTPPNAPPGQVFRAEITYLR